MTQTQLPPLPKDFIEAARTLADAPEHYQFQLGDKELEDLPLFKVKE